MGLGDRLAKVEAVTYAERARAVPCAFHALAEVTPTPPDAETWEGGCPECGAVILYHADRGVPRRFIEAYRELYPVGVSYASRAASRRYAALMVLEYRFPRPPCPEPRDAYARALVAESGRRTFEGWAAFWRSAPDDLLEMWAEMYAEDFPRAELEKVIWPAGLPKSPHLKRARSPRAIGPGR